MLRKPEKDRLHDLASRVARLIPSRRDPEAFHAEKSEIAHDLRQLADTLTATRTERTKP